MLATIAALEAALPTCRPKRRAGRRLAISVQALRRHRRHRRRAAAPVGRGQHRRLWGQPRRHPAASAARSAPVAMSGGGGDGAAVRVRVVSRHRVATPPPHWRSGVGPGGDARAAPLSGPAPRVAAARREGREGRRGSAGRLAAAAPAEARHEARRMRMCARGCMRAQAGGGTARARGHPPQARRQASRRRRRRAPLKRAPELRGGRVAGRGPEL